MKKKVLLIVFSSLSLLSLIGLSISLILGKGFNTWSSISIGFLVLFLLPIVISFLMYLGTTDERVIRPSKKDKDKDKKE